MLLLLCLFSSPALAAGNYYGSVVCEAAEAVLAPYGGIITGLSVRKGDLVRAGSTLCEMQSTKVYAPVSGTVSAVFGEAGDSADEVKDRCGGVVYMIPEARFTVKASLNKATKNDSCYLSIGQPVWLENRGRALRTGTGIVASIATDADNAGNYTVQVTSGSFVLDSRVTVYSSEERTLSTCLGNGTISLAAPVVISGEGSLLRVHVKAGDAVSRGTLLFETVTGTLDGLTGADTRIRSPLDGIVASVDQSSGASVEKNATLLSLYPLNRLQACVIVPETDLASFAVGNLVSLSFGTEENPVDGTVSSISYLAEAEESASAAGYANYKVFIDFEPTANTRLGMLVTVELP